MSIREKSILTYEMGDSIYELAQAGHLIRITRDAETIHVQFTRISTEGKNSAGLKNLNDIIGSFAEYVKFIEESKMFKDVFFSDDEFAKHTNIDGYINYVLPTGEEIQYSQRVDIIKGEMKGYFPPPV